MPWQTLCERGELPESRAANGPTEKSVRLVLQAWARGWGEQKSSQILLLI